MAGAEGTLGIATRLTFRLLGPTRPRQPGGGLLRCHRQGPPWPSRRFCPWGRRGIEGDGQVAAGPGQKQRSGAAGPHPPPASTACFWWSSTGTIPGRRNSWVAGSWPCWPTGHFPATPTWRCPAAKKSASGRCARLPCRSFTSSRVRRRSWRSSKMPWCRRTGWWSTLAASMRSSSATGSGSWFTGISPRGCCTPGRCLNLKDPSDIALLKPLADAVFDLVNRLGGVVSGEHGDGRLRSTYIRRQYPALFPLFQQAKRLLDPLNLIESRDQDRLGSGPDDASPSLWIRISAGGIEPADCSTGKTDGTTKSKPAMAAPNAPR